jgi:hypothetical protein
MKFINIPLQILLQEQFFGNTIKTDLKFNTFITY